MDFLIFLQVALHAEIFLYEERWYPARMLNEEQSGNTTSGNAAGEGIL